VTPTTPRRRRVGLSAWLVSAFVATGMLASLAVLAVVLPTLEGSIRAAEARRTSVALTRDLRDIAQRSRVTRQIPDLETIAAQVGGDVRLWQSNLLSPRLVDAEVTRGYLGEGITSSGTAAIQQLGSAAVVQVFQPSTSVRVGGVEVIQAAVIVLNGFRFDVLEVARPIGGVSERLAVVEGRLVMAVVIVLSLAILTGIALARFLGLRIRRLAGTAATLAQGDLSARATESSPREITSLAGSINRMASRLEGLVDETVSDRDRARALVASLAEGVLSVNYQGEVTVANESARGLLRLPANLTGLRLEDLPSAVRLVLDEALDMEGTAQITETELGGGHHVVLSAVRISKEAGTVVTIRDVTEERRLARARRELIANVSHELKTPLTAVKGFLELLETDHLTPEQRAGFLDLMSQEVVRLERLIAEQLELARLDAGAMSLDREEVDLAGLAEEVCASRRHLGEMEGVEIVASLPPEPVLIEADPARVEQILLILLDNALNHTPSGGKITVGVGIAPGEGTLSVRDTGSGITKEAQEFIFDRFYRADPSREGMGLGLGLSIARGLAEAHGGGIEVRSAPGVGSVFTVRLPLTGSPTVPMPTIGNESLDRRGRGPTRHRRGGGSTGET